LSISSITNVVAVIATALCASCSSRETTVCCILAPVQAVRLVFSPSVHICRRETSKACTYEYEGCFVECMLVSRGEAALRTATSAVKGCTDKNLVQAL